MRVDLFDFDLPEESIALRPIEPRDHARLLRVRPGQPFEDRQVFELPDLLHPGDALVFNDTKVIPAQLEGMRERDGNISQVSATLHMRERGRSLEGFPPSGQAREGRRPHPLRSFRIELLPRHA